MAINSVGREIPEVFNGKKLVPYSGPKSFKPEMLLSTLALLKKHK